MLELIRQGKPKLSRYITTKLNKKNKSQNKKKLRKETESLKLIPQKHKAP